MGRTKRQQQVQRRRPPGETHLAAPQTAEGETFSRAGAARRLADTVYASAAPLSEEFHPLCVVRGDDLGSAFCLQRLQRAQQHPLLQAVELWREARSEEMEPLAGVSWLPRLSAETLSRTTQDKTEAETPEGVRAVSQSRQ